MKNLIILIFITLILYLTLWPSKVDPAKWTPSENPGFTGPYKTNSRLTAAIRINLPQGHGPEDVAIDDKGWAYVGLQDGWIMRAKGSEFEKVVNTGGRPLGLHFFGEKLIVADSYKGLLSVDKKGAIETLSTEAEGVPFGFTDDVDVGSDGRIYFSDASYKFPQSDYTADGLEHRPNGRLLVYDPATKNTSILAKNLYFANGVAVSQKADFVLVNETWKYRILRYWLKGEKKGQMEVFKDALPGFPDGISRGENGVFWLALVSPRNALLESLAPYPFPRKVISRLPGFMRPDAEPYAGVFGLNSDGEVVYNLQDPDAKKLGIISSAQQKGGRLWLGSLKEKAFAYYNL